MKIWNPHEIRKFFIQLSSFRYLNCLFYTPLVESATDTLKNVKKKTTTNKQTYKHTEQNKQTQKHLRILRRLLKNLKFLRQKSVEILTFIYSWKTVGKCKKKMSKSRQCVEKTSTSEKIWKRNVAASLHFERFSASIRQFNGIHCQMRWFYYLCFKSIRHPWKLRFSKIYVDLCQ